MSYVFEKPKEVRVKSMKESIDKEFAALEKAFTRLYNFGPGYVIYPPFDGDPESHEVAVFVNDTWEDYRPTLFSLEGMFGDGTCFGIEFTEEDWQKLVAIVDAKRWSRHA